MIFTEDSCSPVCKESSAVVVQEKTPMRKLTALCLYIILLLGLAGCAAQPAESSAPESSEVQTETPAETQTEAFIPSSSAAETSSEILTTEAASTEKPETESSVPEESADDSTAAESTDSSAAESSAESSAFETSSEDTAAETSTDAETSAEPSTAETTEAPPETTEEPPESTEEPATEYIIAETFRFMLPADWEKQENGSLMADGGSVRIFFCTVPLNDAAFSKGIKIKDKDFGKQLVAYFNDDENTEVTYTIYDSDAADQTGRTESGLDYRFILVRLDRASGSKGASILSAYSLDKENVLVIFFEYELSGGIAAEECLETVNRTIERIK